MRFVFFCLLLVITSASACDVIDDGHNRIQLSQPANRIITLAPDLTEIIYALHAEPQLMAVIEGSDYPENAKTQLKIGSYAGLDLEKIISLHPDLIVTWGSLFSRQLRIFKKNHTTIYVNLPQRLMDVIDTIKNLGCLTGKTKEAAQLASQFAARVKQLQRQFSSARKLSVFYQIGDSFFTVNKNTWINDVIELCGGKNIFRDVTSPSFEVDIESVVAANPDVIIASSLNNHWESRWQRFNKMRAVKMHGLITVPPDLIERAGPRLIAGAESICKNFQSVRENLMKAAS